MQHDSDVYTITYEEDPGPPRARTAPRVERRRGRAARPRVQYAQPPEPGLRALKASTLSLFVCGLGQFYNGQRQLGAALFLLQALVASLDWAALRLWSGVRETAHVFGLGEAQMVLWLAVANYILVVLPLASVHQAYRQAERDTAPFGGLDHPVGAGLASLAVPGWGQLVNGQPGKAVTFLFFFLTGLYTLALLAFTPVFKVLEQAGFERALADRIGMGAVGLIGASAVMWILSFYDAVLVAGHGRRMG
jgi:TM2 domain-containing membrane protein YozV